MHFVSTPMLLQSVWQSGRVLEARQCDVLLSFLYWRKIIRGAFPLLYLKVYNEAVAADASDKV